MRRTINGKRYDTEKAKWIAFHDNEPMVTPQDFHWFSEVLYKTPRGNWFLCGEGNALTRYSGGVKFIPMSEKDALDWCEQTENEEVIAEHFSHLIEEA